MGSTARTVIGLSAALGLILSMPAAWATMDNQKTFKQTYGDKAAKTTCKMCHNAAIGKKGDLNAYGAAQQQMKGEGAAKKLTADDYHALDAADADGDGVSNLDEINAGTAPGDVSSKP